MGLREFAARMFRPRQVEQRDITSVPWDVGGSRYTVVNTDQALSLVPVFASVRLLASQIASLPLHAYRKVGDTRTRIATPSLFTQPAAKGTLYDWLHRCVTSLALRGNAYGLITRRDANEYPTMVEWLHPDDVWVDDLAPSGPGSYTNPIFYWQGRIIPAEDLLHIAWFTVPGRVCGLSPIAACASTMSTGLSAQTYTADWFNNGAVPPGEFRNTAKTVNQTEADIISARLNAAIKRRKPLVYGNDWEYKAIAVSAHEAKFVETLKLNATQVANIFGIPPEMVGGEAGGSLTYNTTEQNGINFVKFTLRPWLELLEQAFTALTPRPQYLKFNVDALLRADLAGRMAAYKTAREIGLNNIDELRALEDEPPLPGGTGQSYAPLGAGAAPPAATRTGVRKFNPGQPRVPGGEHGGEWSTTGAIKDALKLAGRIDLREDESLIASDWVGDSIGDADVVMALLNTSDGPRLYLGIVASDDRRRWSAEDYGSTLELDLDRVRQIRSQLAELDSLARREAAAMEKKVDAYLQEDRPLDFDTDITVAEGVIPGGGWGDLGYLVELNDAEPIGWRAMLGVLPLGSAEKFTGGPDSSVYASLSSEALVTANFEAIQVRKLIRQLDAMTRLAEQQSTVGRSHRPPLRVRSYSTRATRPNMNGNGHGTLPGTLAVLELLERDIPVPNGNGRPKAVTRRSRPVFGAQAMVGLLEHRVDPWDPAAIRHLPGLHDQSKHGRPGLKGALTGSGHTWWTLLDKDTGMDPVPVVDLEIVPGYVVKSGRAYRIDGITYLVEDGAGRPTPGRVVEEFRSFHDQLPEAGRYQRGYAWLAGRNPEDATWADLYNIAGFRSAATAGDGGVRMWDRHDAIVGPEASVADILSHEFGHNVSSGVARRGLHAEGERWLQAARRDAGTTRPTDVRLSRRSGVPSDRLNMRYQAGADWPHGVTEYGTSSSTEDYAESIAFYLADRIGTGRLDPGGPRVPIYFRDLFPERAKILDEVFPEIARRQLAEVNAR